MSLIEKAVRAGVERLLASSRGSLTDYVVNAPHQYGQPRPTAADAQSYLITPARMRELVMKSPTAASAMNAVLDYAGGVKIDVRNRDASKPVPDAQARRVRDFLAQPNTQDNERRFRQRVLRDLFTLGYAAVEQEPNAAGRPAVLWVLDGGRLSLDYDEHGILLGYDMLDAHGIPIAGPGDHIHAWEPEEVYYFALSPVSSSQYPTSRIEQLFAAGVVENMMLAFIGGRFTDSNVPFGVMDLGDITDTELKKAIANWNQQAQAQHRILLTGSKGGSKWTPFGYQLKELEAPQLLAQVRSTIMGIVGVTMQELGETTDVNKSNGYNLSYTFKKRAIEPLLDEYCAVLTHRLLWDGLGFTDLELYYEEIDSRDELLQAQIDDLYMKMGIWSVNHIRNRKGLPDTPGGDEPMYFTGSAWIPIHMAQDFAQVQYDALAGEVAVLKEQVKQARQATQAGAGALQAGVTPPLIRPMQMPEKFTTPDGSGSSTSKVKLPKPKLQPPTNKPAGQGGPSEAPRGPVETAQRAGQRKDQQ